MKKEIFLKNRLKYRKRYKGFQRASCCTSELERNNGVVYCSVR